MIVISYPKSGRTWLLHMLAHYYGYHFGNKDFTPRAMRFLRDATLKPRNWVIGFHEIDAGRLKKIKEHYRKKCIYLVRDPRDCLTSFYFYRIYVNRFWAKRWYRLLRVRSGKKQFVEQFLTGWVGHVNKYVGLADNVIKYEDLLANPFETMKSFMDDVDEGRLRSTIERFDFEKVTGRKRGEESRSTFARKAIVGDWRNHFSDEKLKDIMKPVAGSGLMRFGYERDLDW